MNDKIDIVLPWLNGNDEHWLSKYKNFENTINTGDKGISRIRDWDNLRYFLRGVEKNCEWFNRVILCVFDEYQIPNWLNVNNPKLKILYHRDYIPEQCLPTFNGLCSESFLFRHPDIENNIVYCNDDYFFVNKTKETDYFIDNKCVKVYDETPGDYNFYKTHPDVWSDLMCSTIDFKTKITGKSTNYYTRHTACSFHKSDFTDFYKKYENDIIKEYSKYGSKIRQGTNIIAGYVVDWIQGDKKDYIYDKSFYDKNVVINITKKTNYKSIMDSCLNKTCICLNDGTNNMTDIEFINTKTKIIKILNAVLPEKSSFEK